MKKNKKHRLAKFNRQERTLQVGRGFDKLMAFLESRGVL